MPKANWNQYSTTAGSNTDVGGVDTDESSMMPSDVNNAIRELMSHTADVVAGTVALSSINIDGGAIDGVTIGGAAAGAGTFTGLSVSGVLSAANGSNSAPSITFANDTDNGFAYINANNWGLVVGGVWNMYFQGPQNFTNVNLLAINSSGPGFLNEAATATNPTLVPNRADLDTGVGWATTDELTLVTAGAERMRITSSGVSVTGDVAASGTINPTGDTASGDDAAIGYTSAEGLILTGQGSTSDLTVKNDADATVCYVPTGADDLRFPDNAKLELGTGADLQIYHDGSDSYISDGGTGDLKIGGATNVKIQNPIGSEIMGIFAADGAVTLYYDNAVKFATASAGVSITGGITSTGTVSTLSINGSAPTATGADVLTLLRSGSAGNYADLNVVAGNTGRSRINFGDTDDMDVGQVSYDHNDNSMAFSTAAAERMRIESSGDIGIGTTAPHANQKIHMYGGASGGAGSTDFGMTIENSGDSQLQFLAPESAGYTSRINFGSVTNARDGMISYTQQAKYMAFNVANAERMRINATGIGIGTTGPTAPLDVRGYAAGVGSIYANAGAASQFLMTLTDGVATNFSIVTAGAVLTLGSDAGSTQTALKSTGAERMRLDASGNIGIGCTDPGAKLDVRSGEIKLSDSRNIQWGGANCRMDGANNGDWRVFTASTERIRITNAGNVGIGTTSPSYSLTVESTGAVGFQVTQTGAGNNSERIIASHASFTGNVVQPWTVRAANSAFDLIECVTNNGSEVPFRVRGDGAVSCTGALSKGSGSFKISHPLPEKSETHNLVHSFIEGPQADLIYRGKAELTDGAAMVNIDSAAGMSEGTFALLCRDVQCFTSNESGWTAIKGSVAGNILTIAAQDEACTDTVSWMVIGERQDEHMYETDWTDDEGKVIVEPLIVVEPPIANEGADDAK